MVPEAQLPSTDAIRRDLEHMVARWGELPEEAVFEIRAFKEGAAAPKVGKFSPDDLDEAVEWIESLNELGHNIYAVRNPIRKTCAGSATDDDIIGSFFLWADCDDPAAAGNVYRFDGPKWTAAVTTGTVPDVRVHTYWQLERPCYDMADWRAMQMQIAQHFGSDKTVVNPSRIMRVGGTVAYPAKHKQERGYIKEVTRLRTEYEEPREPVTFDQMRRVFGSQSITNNVGSGLTIDTGPVPLDRERTRIQALDGKEWHNAVIRLVASYVSKGLSDDEIHGLTAPLTLPDYTVDQTRAEVQTAIDGARAKGWTPENFLEPAPLSDEQKAEIPATLFKAWVRKDLSQIPYPDFVYSDFYARGYTSLTLASPKVGKSMLALAESLDMSTGRGFLTGIEREPLKVVYYNAEDDQNVLDARVSALLTQYGIDQSEIEGRFWPTSGVEADDFYMVTGQDGVINEPLFVGLEKFCTEQRADVLIFDPLQDLSASPETNEVFRLLGQRLRRLANTTGVALGIVHHTRKIAPGMQATIEDGRGGSALRGTARFNRILNPMTEDEAAKAGVENHRYYFRIGDMESNLAPPSADVNRWFEKQSILTPNGQSVGAVSPWQWPDAFDGITPQKAAMVRNTIDRMAEPPRFNVRARDWVGETVADVLGLNLANKADKSRVKALVAGWINSDVLRVTEAKDSRAGRTVEVVVAGANDPLETGGQA